jgi:hypothetical protein
MRLSLADPLGMIARDVPTGVAVGLPVPHEFEATTMVLNGCLFRS